MATRRIASEGRRLARSAAQGSAWWFRLGEIDDDALISLFDCQRKPPPVCAVLCQF